MKHEFCSPVKARGIAAVEMVFVIPILLLLGFGVIEVSHAIQAKNISTALAREGANLASRSTADSDQEIMDALVLSADPLDFSQDGVIYISVVVGDPDVTKNPYIVEQHRLINYGNSSLSKVWEFCSTWVNGECQLPLPRPCCWMASWE